MFMMKAEIEAMFKRKSKRASIPSACLELEPPYPDKLAAIQFPLKYKVPKFQEFNGRKGNTGSTWLASSISWALSQVI